MPRGRIGFFKNRKFFKSRKASLRAERLQIRRCVSDNATADFNAGISGRLCGKVIRRAVDNQGTADNFGQFKPVRIEGAISVTFVAKKRRHVSGMFRVRHTVWIIVVSGFLKRKGAVSGFVDMHTIKLAVGRHIFVRQAMDFRFDPYTACRNAVEIGFPMQRGIIGISGDFCECAGIRIVSHK